MGFGYKEDGIISPLTITSRRTVMLMNIDHLFHGGYQMMLSEPDARLFL